MAVTHRVTGTWAELTADGTVAIPATPQAGDRMYLFARWKDFSITASVANWTELAEFADGSAGSGNGTGSVKVGCWYRDWQAGDSDPTIDFSANPTNASVVIMVMQKDADDVWLTPVARTAAMTNWTTTSQSVSASATAAVPSSGVVMGLIGIRDDTATMTRPTNGIDDAGGLVTWNGNYIESPATHHSTTTGDDGAADLGYRLVTTGATATLRLTGTISAAETGAALWVVQGISTVVTPTVATFTSSGLVPVLLLALIPTTATVSTAQFAPQLQESVTPAAALLTSAGFAPVLQERITPSAVTLTVSATAPQLHEALIPVTASLSVVAFAITLRTSAAIPVSTLVLSTFGPTITLATTITIPVTTFTITTRNPHILPYRMIFLDPGGDAVQAIGYFQTQVGGSGGIISFDTTQKVNGAGSYKFNSDDGDSPHVIVPNVLNAIGAMGVGGTSRRVSAWFRYDSVPDATATTTQFVSSSAVYSGGGFVDNVGGGGLFLDADDGLYNFATPNKNSGSGLVFGSFGFASGSSGSIPNEAAIKAVKIIYERKYDTADSIGISRVKWRIDGVEGPDHDNTDEPTTDTVVEVDVTTDREFWSRSDLADGVFEVIAEARRGDSDTEHIQSWDYVKAEVEYFMPFSVLAPGGDGLAFEIALIPRNGHVTLRLIDGDKVWYDGITKLFPDTDYRISWSYLLHDTDLVDIKLYVGGIEELSIEDAACAGGTGNLVNLQYGWVGVPGVDHVCWFDQFYIDEGDDLTDCGNVLSTAKLPATVNENNWDTTGGTGAVNERPLSETNYREHAAPIDVQYQTYNLQTAASGDIDISGESLLGYMGWVWAQLGGGGDPNSVKLITNGQEAERLSQLGSTPKLIRLPTASAGYPNNARGVGMYVDTEFATAAMFECGVVVAYEGSLNPDILLPRQEVANETLDTIIDNLRADPPDSYEVCCAYDDFDGSVQIIIHSLDQDGGSVQYQGTLNSNGRVRITPGVEVYLDVTVTGVTSLQIWRRLNVG